MALHTRGNQPSRRRSLNTIYYTNQPSNYSIPINTTNKRTYQVVILLNNDTVVSTSVYYLYNTTFLYNSTVLV